MLSNDEWAKKMMEDEDIHHEKMMELTNKSDRENRDYGYYQNLRLLALNAILIAIINFVILYKIQ